MFLNAVYCVKDFCSESGFVNSHNGKNKGKVLNTEE